LKTPAVIEANEDISELTLITNKDLQQMIKKNQIVGFEIREKSK